MSNGEEMPDRDDKLSHNPSRQDDVLMPEWTSDGHVEEGSIHAWLDDAFDAAQSETVHAHVTGCAVCQAAVAEARGFIAGASRVAKLLDAVPTGVVSSEDVARTASRILATATATATARGNAGAKAGAIPPFAGVRQPRWFGRNVFRIAATALVFVGGAYVWSRTPDASVADFARASESSIVDAPKADAPTPSESDVAVEPVVTATDAVASAGTKKAEDAERERQTPVGAAASNAMRDQSGARAAMTDNDVRASTEAAPPLVAAASAPPSIAGAAIAVAKATETPPQERPVQRLPETVVAATLSPPVERLRSPGMVTSNTATISGRITDDAGKGVAAATVAARNVAPTSAVPQAQTLSDSTGRFALKVASDSVDIEVRRLGYARGTTRIRTDGRDSLNVVIPIRAETNRLSSVVVTQEQTPLSSAQCLAYSLRASSSENAPPRLVRMEAPPALSSGTTVRQATWQGMFASDRVITVRMLLEANTVWSGSVSDPSGGQSRTLRMTLSPEGREWTGNATLTVNGDVAVFAVRYESVPLTMCKF